MMKVLERTQKIPTRLTRALPLVFLLMFSAPARSSTFIFVTPPGATTSNAGAFVPVDVKATFTLDLVNQTITVDLLNLELNPQFDYQALGSVQISLSNLNGSATPPTVLSSSFSAINLHSAPTPAAVSPTPANVWAYPTSGAYAVGPGILEFCADCIGNLGSKQLVMGGPNASTGLYDAAGSSITSTGHQPYILGSGDTYSSGDLQGLNSTPEWVLKVPQLSPTTTVTAATFGFGTAYVSSQFVTGQAQDPALAPEPGAGSLVFTGCFLIGLSVFLKQRRSSTANRTRVAGR